ncbi:hypothetical protein MKW94_026116 [Papaver nudicaule]|uniref:Uncharacterized protein n=1 Tax=Papaver nudicaule TaxID=74823 RepID=A0AA42AY75_PAPNU|nr:hypothetical protein [Papaver nudicaule]
MADSESGKVHIEFPKKSDKGGSSSSSSSSDSSDDESNVVKKIEGKIESSKKKVLEEFKDGMSGISNAFSGILPHKDKVEKVASSSEDSTEKIVSSVEEKIEGSGSLLPASVPPSVDTSKAPETPDSPEKKELLPIVPVTVQPASWKNCCGLFEVLTGSNR